MLQSSFAENESLPSRKRGLKFQTALKSVQRGRVASFAEAWIEIKNFIKGGHDMLQSLPSRKRGLKLIPFIFVLLTALSLPSRKRGLKSSPNH